MTEDYNDVAGAPRPGIEAPIKTVKVVTLEGTFPELPSPKMYVTGRGEGGTLKSAFAAAGRNLLSHKNLKARRLSAFTLIVSVGTRTVEQAPARLEPKGYVPVDNRSRSDV